MDFLYNHIFLSHDTGDHPENRSRLESLGQLTESGIPNGEQYLSLVHSDLHIAQVREACKHSLQLDADTLTSPGSYAAAVHAVGAAIMASETNGFALIRPPGHHAYADHSSGFCLFNNIAVAAQKLVNEGKRVAIMDFDGHYGDGTADIFYSTDKVLYCSLHQFPAYPGKGWLTETGSGAGKGYTVNVPLPPGAADDLFMDAIENVLVPVIRQFNPDVLGISAGFDACIHDPLLQLNVSIGCFHKLGTVLGKEFRNMFALLEGGYNTEALPKCIINFVNGVNQEQIRYKEPETASAQEVIEEYQLRQKLIADLLQKNRNVY
jgi:acetoin utilization deacetylase AcuC-like enzyme